MKDSKTHSSDEDLLNNFYRTSNNYWLGILLQRYSMLLLGVCMKYLNDEEKSKDSVQEIFLKVLSEVKRHRVSYFKGWIYSVARNHCLQQIRKSQRDNYVTEELIEESYDHREDGGVEDKISEEKQFILLSNSLETLNEDQKKCVRLFYIDNKSYKEIAESTGFTILQVKSFIQNGKRNLKIIMDKKQQNG